MTEAVELLNIYLDEWRPLLTSGASRLLFPGKISGQNKGKSALSTQIKELVHAYTRLDMPAHRFRHAAGKIYLDRNPGEYEVIRQLLGHKDSEHDDRLLCRGRERHRGAALCANHSSNSRRQQ